MKPKYKKIDCGEGKKICVKELSIATILEAKRLMSQKDVSFKEGVDFAKEKLIPSCIKIYDSDFDSELKDATLELLAKKDFYPSDLEVVFDAFKELNTVFLSITKFLGLMEKLQKASNVLLEAYLGAIEEVVKEKSLLVEKPQIKGNDG